MLLVPSWFVSPSHSTSFQQADPSLRQPCSPTCPQDSVKRGAQEDQALVLASSWACRLLWVVREGLEKGDRYFWWLQGTQWAD